ncbi:hypothetical protein BJ165DRAFT_1400946 [Panaeolus papilionaceus]|nr:hypothetical protein BJ165DRAFT_1400946 [Panaeolus papilionaceus]
MITQINNCRGEYNVRKDKDERVQPVTKEVFEASLLAALAANTWEAQRSIDWQIAHGYGQCQKNEHWFIIFVTITLSRTKCGHSSMIFTYLEICILAENLFPTSVAAQLLSKNKLCQSHKRFKDEAVTERRATVFEDKLVLTMVPRSFKAGRQTAHRSQEDGSRYLAKPPRKWETIKA